MPSIDFRTVPDHSIQVSVDRGGTFTDVYASWPLDASRDSPRKEVVVKLMSVDPLNYADAPTEGIRRVLEMATGQLHLRGEILKTNKIDYIRLSTTVATNALLERKGARHAFLVTKGFKDLLHISHQSRPSIFALNVQRPSVLYSSVLEIDERVTLVGFTSDPKFSEHAVQFDEQGNVIKAFSGPGLEGSAKTVKQGISGEAVRIIKEPDMAVVKADLEALYSSGIRTLAICLAHSYTYPVHELAIEKVAKEIGFTHISVSSVLSPQIKMVPRGMSSSADAYLTPILKAYLESFFKGFEAGLGEGNGARVEFMTSEGSLVDHSNFSGLRSILSGPAGGVVGYSLTSWDKRVGTPVIGFDMGGTSTDVSRFDGRHETVFETSVAGISLQTPQLDINTVAAGGGSCLTFRNGLFLVGPESASAQPGPSCYRKGGPLTTTDANLILGRLLPDYFPKIFGPTEDMPLDMMASKKGFERLTKEINAHIVAENGSAAKIMSLDEVAYGFIRIANETMASPIRTLTEARGFSTAKHILASFGGAGGQHACEIARSLGITQILIHRFSSILSAYGMSLADRAYELQEPCSVKYSSSSQPYLMNRLQTLKTKVVAELKRQGFSADRVSTEQFLNMRFEGSDASIMTPAPSDGSFDYQAEFLSSYRREYGFILEDTNVVVDDVRVRGIGKTYDTLGHSIFDEMAQLQFTKLDRLSTKVETETSVFFTEVGRQDVPVYMLGKLNIGDVACGPAIIVDGTQTIVLDPKSEAKVCSKHLFISLSI